MQNAVEAYLNTGEPGRDKAANAYSQAAAEDPPKTGTNSQRAGQWRAAGIGVDGPEADARAKQAEQKLKNDDEDDAARNGGP
jgi:hypothetical protein